MAKAQKRSWFHLGDVITIRIPVRQVAMAAIVFIIGLTIGRVTFKYNTREDLSSREAIRSLQSAVPIGQFELVPSAENPDDVEIRFQTIQERRLIGSLQDPEVQFALSYALVNAPQDNIRLKSLGLLQPSSDDESVHRALIHAVEKDENPGVRLKALKLLKTLPVSEGIKNILISSLFQDPNAGIRVEAAKTLSGLEDPTVLPLLEKKAGEDDYIRALIAKISENKPVSLSREK